MRQEVNNGFGPIPRKRGRAYVNITSVVLVLVCIGIAIAFETPKCILEESGLLTDGSDKSSSAQQTIGTFVVIYQIAFVISVVFLTHVGSEFLRRLCLFVEEIRHINDRYDGSVWKAFKTTYRVQDFMPVAVLFSVMGLFFILMISTEISLFSSYFHVYGDIVLTFMAVHIFSNVLVGLKAHSEVEISEFSEQDHLNVAHGLAWSYYFGYLKIILPELENTIAKSQYNDSMKAGELLPKLFIIIPENCIIPANVAIEDHGRMKFENQLPPLYVDRAGVKGRPYVNSVYQVEDSKGILHYCIMEFATPIDSLNKMSEHPEAGLNANDRRQQVRIFLKTLQHILNTAKECKKRCQLVPISGDYDKNPLADAVSKTIREIKQETLDIDI